MFVFNLMHEADEGEENDEEKPAFPPLPEGDSSHSEEAEDDQKQRKDEARFAKVLTTSMTRRLRLNSKSLSRSSLPKLDYICMPVK